MNAPCGAGETGRHAGYTGALLGCIALACVASSAASGALDQPFVLAGFRRDMDLAVLLDRYPRSSHEVSPAAGVRRRTSQDDPKDWMLEFFHTRGASGTYVLRLTPGESHDHVFYVQADVRDEVTERLWLLLEMPLDLMKPTPKGNETRYPSCDGVLRSLAVTYGKPKVGAPRLEEALESFDYGWTNSHEAMTLQCGRYTGQKAAFAIGVTLEKTGSR